jgi:hypothetical protein
MDLGRIQKNQEIFSSLLDVTCIATIAVIIQFLVPIPLLSILLFIPFFGYNLIKIIRKINSNSKQAIFDLSVPIVFEPGSLIFKSQTETHAVFFALSLTLQKQKAPNLKRTLLLLLKILPENSIFAIEWTSENQCYLTFYLKFLKTEIIAKAKALIESIQSSFQKVLGANSVKLLDSEEITHHLTLGITGTIQKAVRKGKYTLLVQTDETQTQLSFLEIANPQKSMFPLIFQHMKEYTEPYRIIFMAKKIPNQAQLHTTLTILTEEYEKSLKSQLTKLLQVKSRYLQSSNLIHQIGDLLTRNIIKDTGQILDFSLSTENLFTFLQTCIKSMIQKKTKLANTQQSQISKQEWRNYLNQITRQLGINTEMNPFISIDGVPLRLDAKIKKYFIKIILGDEPNQLKWLGFKLTQLVQSKEEELILLCNPKVSSFFEKIRSNSVIQNKLHLITSKSQLKEWLQSLETTAEDQPNVAVEVC